MKIRKMMVVIGLALVGLTALVLAVQAAGIQDTRHNLSSSQTATGFIRTTGTTEICVFCHTPHGADTSIEAPLWNRAVTTSGYTPYSSPSLDATVGQPTGASVACLSCHAGDIAFDALRNLPGSGGFTSSPSKEGVTSWTFERVNIGPLSGKKMPATDETGGENVRLLGLDLSNDHPISMLYSAAKSPSSSSGTNDHATGFKDPPGGISTTGDSYFDNGLKLSKGYVQCTSCHDPHRSDNPTFLRINNGGQGNAGSAVCLTCHNKDG